MDEDQFYDDGLNPYFIGLPILMIVIFNIVNETFESLNPYFIGLPILIMREK